jgi:hypothetical protein
MDDISEHVQSVVRLTLRTRRDGSVELVDQQRVVMPLVPTTDDPGEDPPIGFWHELRNEDGQVFHRRLMPNPLSNRVEVPTGNPREPLAYRTTDQPRRHIFFVDVPDVKDARTLVLVEGVPRQRRPADPGQAGEERQHPVETREVARFRVARADEPTS